MYHFHRESVSTEQRRWGQLLPYFLELQSNWACWHRHPYASPRYYHSRKHSNHNVIGVNETLISLRTQLLDQGSRSGAEVIHFGLGIDQFATQQLENALSRHDLLLILEVIRSSNLEIFSCQTDPTIFRIFRISGLDVMGVSFLQHPTRFQWVGYFFTSKYELGYTPPWRSTGESSTCSSPLADKAPSFSSRICLSSSNHKLRVCLPSVSSIDIVVTCSW